MPTIAVGDMFTGLAAQGCANNSRWDVGTGLAAQGRANSSRWGRGYRPSGAGPCQQQPLGAWVPA